MPNPERSVWKMKAACRVNIGVEEKQAVLIVGTGYDEDDKSIGSCLCWLGLSAVG
jgi:hypothetical protein